MSIIKSMHVHEYHIDDIFHNSVVDCLKSQNITIYHLIVLQDQIT